MKPHPEPRETASDAEPETDAPPRDGRGPNESGGAEPFVFKIVPADPKNAFDFEDVADK